FFSSRRRHTRWPPGWSSDVCSSDLADLGLRQGLAQLLTRLGTEATALDWLRVLYLYPSTISSALLDVYAQQERLCPYFDMPMQRSEERRVGKEGRSRSWAYECEESC